MRANPRRTRPVTSTIVAVLTLLMSPAVIAGTPDQQLEARIADLDREMTGSLGVYIRHLGEGWSVGYRTDQDWYLASTIKIPLGIALMQQAEAGELSLDEELPLREADFVDGSGDLLWHDPGERFTLVELNRRSIRDSDSTATDLLIGYLGVDRLNELVAGFSEPGTFSRITPILQVRHDAWSEVHPDARKLTNLDFIELSTERDAARRHGMVLDKLGIDAGQADAGSTREAFRRYYQTGDNSGNLEQFGRLLERLVRGELLDEQHTNLLLDIMESVTTGDRRLKAGFPKNTAFAHKTGTQIDRACNVGIVRPRSPDDAVVVMACARDYDKLGEAEHAFSEIGHALGEFLH
jgi:beta-lactamase class A